jgi:hypothetical protein
MVPMLTCGFDRSKLTAKPRAIVNVKRWLDDDANDVKVVTDAVTVAVRENTSDDLDTAVVAAEDNRENMIG